MATAPVDIPVIVKGLQDLKRLQSQMDALEKELTQVQGKLPKATKDVERFGKAGATSSKGFGALTGALGKLGLALSVVSALKFSIVKTAELETQTKSLEVLTGSLEKAQTVISELQDFASVTPFTSSELIETSKRLKAFGVSTEKLVDTTRRLGDVAGATGADLSGIATAYGQIQAKGKLQTEELLQLQERGVDLASVLKKEYNLTGEEFSDALRKGQISAQAAEAALQKLTDTGGMYADGAIAQSTTLAGKFSTLQDNIGRVAIAIGKLLAPAIGAILDLLNQVISKANQAISALNDLQLGEANQKLAIGATQLSTGFSSDALDIFAQGLNNVNPALIKSQAEVEKYRRVLQRYSDQLTRIGPESPLADDAVKLQGTISGLIRDVSKLDGTFKEATSGTIEIKFPELELPEPGEIKTGGGNAEAERQRRELERQLEQQKQQEEAARDLVFQSENQLALAGEMTRYETILAEANKTKLEIQRKYDKLLANSMSNVETKLLNEAKSNELKTNELKIERSIKELKDNAISDINEEIKMLEAKLAGKEKEVKLDIRATQLARELPFLTKEDILAQLKKNQALQEQVDLQEKNKQILDSVVNQTGQQLMGLFDALISGTEDWNKTLQNTLKQLSSILLKAGVSALGGGDKRGLFSILAGDFGGTRANGGPVKAGKPYLVGEKGPELMVPRSSGTVVPNGAGMGSTNVSITVNADGGVQASSQGSQAEEASRLARMIEASTVSIINREKRPGGILSR